MRVRFYSEDKTQYVTIRPEEYKDCVYKRRRKERAMPLPKPSNKVTATSSGTLQGMDEMECKLKLMAIINDFEETLLNSGKDAMLSIKLGFKEGYQVSLKPNKTSMWYNTSGPTLIAALERYLKGEFD